MNANTVSTITGVLGMMNPALGLIGSLVAGFTNNDASAKFTKFSSQVQQAGDIVLALAPLVQQFAAGNDITPEDVRIALAGKEAALTAFDAEIAKQGG